VSFPSVDVIVCPQKDFYLRVIWDCGGWFTRSILIKLGGFEPVVGIQLGVYWGVHCFPYTNSCCTYYGKI
jgi:hypothetical protein